MVEIVLTAKPENNALISSHLELHPKKVTLSNDTIRIETVQYKER